MFASPSRPLAMSAVLGLAVAPAAAFGQVVVGPGPVVIERQVIVPRPGPFIGSPFGPRRVFVARPAVITAPTTIIAPPPVVVVEPPPPVIISRPAVVIDPYQNAIGRLRSKHNNSRRDGAITLGRIGDPRAVPDLVWLLQNDRDPDVREASAFALGAIGDARAMNVLRHAAMTDRNRRVRQAASHAHGKITFNAPVVVSSPVETIIESPAVEYQAPREVEPRRPLDARPSPAGEPALEPLPEPTLTTPRPRTVTPSPPTPMPPPADEVELEPEADNSPPAAPPPRLEPLRSGSRSRRSSGPAGPQST